MNREELKRIAHELRTYNPAADEYKGEHIHKVWAKEIEAILASAQDVARAPEGWKLAPIEPTSEMLSAMTHDTCVTWRQRYRAAFDIAPAAPAVAPDRTVDELSMLVRRLVHALRKADPGKDLAEQAMDYLKRKGLQGSPLRTAAPAQAEQQGDGGAKQDVYVIFAEFWRCTRNEAKARAMREMYSPEPEQPSARVALSAASDVTIDRDLLQSLVDDVEEYAGRHGFRYAETERRRLEIQEARTILAASAAQTGESKC